MSPMWLSGFSQSAIVRLTTHQKTRFAPHKLDDAHLTHPSERSHGFAIHRNFDGTRIAHPHDSVVYEVNVILATRDE